MDINKGPEQRQQFIGEIRSKLTSLENKLGSEKFEEWRIACLDKITSHFTAEQCRDCILFHMMIFSSPPACSTFDFPGEDSVQKMIEQALMKRE